MTGTVVQANNLDSVRIEVLGEARSTQIPCSLLFAIDRLLSLAGVHGEDVSFEESDGTWTLTAGQLGFGEGATPWGAVADWERRFPQ
jgi:hypothetical protein